MPYFSAFQGFTSWRGFFGVFFWLLSESFRYRFNSLQQVALWRNPLMTPPIMSPTLSASSALARVQSARFALDFTHQLGVGLVICLIWELRIYGVFSGFIREKKSQERAGLSPPSVQRLSRISNLNHKRLNLRHNTRTGRFLLCRFIARPLTMGFAPFLAIGGDVIITNYLLNPFDLATSCTFAFSFCSLSL